MKYLTTAKVMWLCGVTKAMVYRKLHGIQTGRHGARKSHHPPWTERGAYFDGKHWQIPERLAKAYAKQRRGT
jgi:hypothetical protein